MKLILVVLASIVVFAIAQTTKSTPKPTSTSKPPTTSTKATTKANTSSKKTSATTTSATKPSTKTTPKQTFPTTAKGANATNSDFKAWKAKYGKSYKSSASKSEADAQKTFQENAKKVADHNSCPNVTYKQSLNSNADLNANEIATNRTGFKPDLIGNYSQKTQQGSPFSTTTKSPTADQSFKGAKAQFKSSIPAAVDLSM